MRTETKQLLDKIMDTFSGSDGGASYVLLVRLIEDMDQQAAAGDGPAQEVLDKTLLPLSRLIDLAAKPLGGSSVQHKKPKKGRKRK